MPLPEHVDTLQRQLMRDEVYLKIRLWIVEGVLQPEEKVRDKELAKLLGVSRMPIREALRSLTDEGLVEVAANRWTRVAPIEPDDARRIYPIIWSLETLAINLAGERLGPAEIEVMERANVRLREAIEAGEPVDASSADAKFHQVYVEASGNTDLIKIITDLKVKLRRLEIAYFDGSVTAARSLDEHEAILQALRKGDLIAAVEGVRGNWERSLQRILARQTSAPIE